VYWFSRVLVRIVSWFSQEDWLGLINASKEVNNLVPPPKDLGVFLTVLEVEGNSWIWRFKKHQIQGVLEVWGSVLRRSWRIRALIWRNSCKHCNQHLLHSGWPWWRLTSSSRVDVALSEDEKGWTTINTGFLSLSLSFLLFDITCD
jgi:hypothetical protein